MRHTRYRNFRSLTLFNTDEQRILAKLGNDQQQQQQQHIFEIKYVYRFWLRLSRGWCITSMCISILKDQLTNIHGGMI